MKRHTRQRQVVLEELQGLTSHPTATDLYEIVRKRLPNISLGTVYRNLELLAGNNIIRKLELSSGKTRYDGDLASHNHVRCVNCGRVDDLSDLPGEVVGDQPQELNGYKILGHRLEFYGVCPGCRRADEDENAP